MIPYWPTSLPQRPSIRFTGGPQDNRVSFSPDYGMPIERPKGSDAPEIYDVGYEVFDLEDYAVFKAWFKDDLASGTKRFAWRHPIGDSVALWRIVSQDPPYTVTAASGGQFVSLTMRIMRVPGEPWFVDYVPSDTSRVPDFVADYDNDVYGVQGEKVAASALPDIEGEYLTVTTNATSVVRTVETLTAGDIPATAPAGVTSIIGFLA